jgi:hypothetical protein
MQVKFRKSVIRTLCWLFTNVCSAVGQHLLAVCQHLLAVYQHLLAVYQHLLGVRQHLLAVYQHLLVVGQHLLAIYNTCWLFTNIQYSFNLHRITTSIPESLNWNAWNSIMISSPVGFGKLSGKSTSSGSSLPMYNQVVVT